MRHGQLSRRTHRKDERYSAANGFAAIQNSLVAHPQVLGAIAVLPADNSCAVKKNLNALTRGKASGDFAVVRRDVDRWLSRVGDGRNGGWLVWTVDHAGQQLQKGLISREED